MGYYYKYHPEIHKQHKSVVVKTHHVRMSGSGSAFWSTKNSDCDDGQVNLCDTYDYLSCRTSPDEIRGIVLDLLVPECGCPSETIETSMCRYEWDSFDRKWKIVQMEGWKIPFINKNCWVTPIN